MGKPFGPRSRASHRVRILGLGLSASIAFAGCAKKVEPSTQPNGITFTSLGNYTGTVTQTACIQDANGRRCGKPVATRYVHGKPQAYDEPSATSVKRAIEKANADAMKPRDTRMFAPNGGK